MTNMHDPGTAEIGRDKNWWVHVSFMLSKPAVLLSWFTNTEMLTDYSALQKPSLFNCKKCGTLSISACIKQFSIHPLNEAILLRWDLNCRLKYPHFLPKDNLAFSVARSSGGIVVQPGELSALLHLPWSGRLHSVSCTDFCYLRRVRQGALSQCPPLSNEATSNNYFRLNH